MKILVSVFVLLLSSQALANTCFWADRIWDFRVVNDRTLVVREANNRRYRVDVGFCTRLQWAQKIAFRGWGSNYICSHDDLLVFTSYSSNRPDEICRIRRITRM